MSDESSVTKEEGGEKKVDFADLDIDTQVDMILHALEGEVMPLLRSHGGGLEIMDIEKYNVIVKYYGTCHGCPLSSTGTLDFIEYTLQDQVDERIRVLPDHLI